MMQVDRISLDHPGYTAESRTERARTPAQSDLTANGGQKRIVTVYQQAPKPAAARCVKSAADYAKADLMPQPILQAQFPTEVD